MKKLLILAALISGAAAAQTNLDFDGTVSSTCALTINQNGALGIDVSAPTILSSRAAQGGASAALGVQFIGTPTLTINGATSFSVAPTLTFTPTFTNYASSSLGGTLAFVSDVATYAYTTGSADTVTLDTEASTGGFEWPTGAYRATVVVTCS